MAAQDVVGDLPGRIDLVLIQELLGRIELLGQGLGWQVPAVRRNRRGSQ